MATYYVDGNSGNDASGDGSSNKPWKTLTKANGAIKAGDEVRARTATYHEVLNISKPNTTWRADTGHKPAVDGKYGPNLMVDGHMPQPGQGHLPGSPWGNLININADGVVIDGFISRNSAGSGIGTSRSDVVIRNCTTDFVSDNGIKVHAGAGWSDRVIIENNIVVNSSVRRTISGEPTWSAGMAVAKMRDGIIRNNVVGYSYGEGINIHKGSLRVIVEGNVVHTCKRCHIYIQRSSGNVIRNNMVFHIGTPIFMNPGEGLIISDEIGSVIYPASVDNQLYNNLVIGTSYLFCVWSNKASYDNNKLDRAYIGYNTFIGGPLTKVGVNIVGNQRGNPHANSIFENNIISNMPTGTPISGASGDISGVLFRNNLWDVQPTAAMRGVGDRIGTPGLVNSAVAVVGAFPDPNTNIDPRNYQLTSKSNLAIGMASDGSMANGLTPPAIQKDFFGLPRDNNPDIGAHEYVGVNVELTANFSIGPGQATGSIPHTVDFIDKSTSAHLIASHLWNFGDGETSTETNPSHTYSKAGNFDVSLTVTDDTGASNTIRREGLISATEVPNTILPNSFRRFVLIKVDDEQVLAYGTQYPDLRCILTWNLNPFHILNFDNIEDAEDGFIQSGELAFVWIDSDDQDAPSLIDIASEQSRESVLTPT